MVRPTNRGTQHVLHVPVTGNISGQMHVLCIRNFVTYAGLKQIGKWPLLKIRGQWAMRFSDISGHRCIRICIVLPIFFYNWWLQRLRVNKLSNPCIQTYFLVEGYCSLNSNEMLKWKPNTKFFWVKNSESTQEDNSEQKEVKWRNPSNHTYTFSSRARFWRAKEFSWKAFSMTKRKNSSFKRTLPQLLNMHTLDAITFWTMFSVF